jgi:hypothetical protein
LKILYRITHRKLKDTAPPFAAPAALPVPVSTHDFESIHLSIYDIFRCRYRRQNLGAVTCAKH